ncbi:hypothetical protein [Endozoicomonas sp. 4G]|uniref:hypothetical protein n=1 Tax=Endozoicomonas sp. 4G TaxID=2872754 RepID=UPI002078B69E|nr:hypothetical protein [Endozoicomonas sp. 4G]
MKQSLFAARLLLLLSLPAICQADSFTRHLVVEQFVAVGWLLKSYWNPDSLLFDPGDQQEASRDDPFTIITMMLPGQNKQQSDQQTPSSESPSQQASGTTSHVRGSFTHPLSSGSGGGNEHPEQDLHTFGLNCYAGSCHGVCELRQKFNNVTLAEESLSYAESSTGHSHHEMTETQPSQPQAHEGAVVVGKIDENAAACHIISETINHLHWLKAILIEKDVPNRGIPPNPNIQVFSNAIELLKLLNPSDISITQKRIPDRGFSFRGYSYTWLHFFYKGKPLFTVEKTDSEFSFSDSDSYRKSVDIKTEELFIELYALYVPGYQYTKGELERFEKCRKK